MKKLKLLIGMLFILCLTGCFEDRSMENITISTSVYPIQYIVSTLYGNHSTINSIYPTDSEAIGFEVTDVLLNGYSDSDMFIFNGLSKEKEYVKYMTQNNKDLKIIDVTSNMYYENSIEELWLDPNKMLTIANNIKKGFNEYINSSYLVNEINDKYDDLKIELTNIDGKYYSTVKNSSNNVIIVSDNAFSYLKKYGINVISLDPDTVTTKDISDAKKYINDKIVTNIYIKYGEELSKTLKDVIGESDVGTLELYTMTNLYNIDTSKTNYITLMNENLENLKEELYK